MRATGDAELAEKLRYMREYRKLPLKAAASKARVTTSAVCEYEAGRAMPSVRVLARLAKLYGVSPYYFMRHLADSEADPAA